MGCEGYDHHDDEPEQNPPLPVFVVLTDVHNCLIHIEITNVVKRNSCLKVLVTATISPVAHTDVASSAKCDITERPQ
jgi:hypothetical protein